MENAVFARNILFFRLFVNVFGSVCCRLKILPNSQICTQSNYQSASSCVLAIVGDVLQSLRIIKNTTLWT